MNKYFGSFVASNWLIIATVIDIGHCTPIVGGESVLDGDGAFSFAVSIQHKQRNNISGYVTHKHFCGGVLLQVFNRIALVITASHCMTPSIKIEDISIVFGANSVQNYQGIRFDSLQIFKQNYDRYTMSGDICLIKVFMNGCEYPKLNPIRIIMDVATAMDDACFIFGYGAEKIAGEPTLDLRVAPVKIISPESCFAKLGYSAPGQNSGMFCAVGAKPGVDACSGDSGSGLICIHNELLAIVGITTYGLDCGINNMPGVYTAIADHSSYVRSVVSNGNWFDGKRPFTYSHN